MAAAAWGTGASIALFAPSQADDPAARKAQARFERESASPAMARALVESLMLTDVERLLSMISVPTLVVHRVEDMVPVEEGAVYRQPHCFQQAQGTSRSGPPALAG